MDQLEVKLLQLAAVLQLVGLLEWILVVNLPCQGLHLSVKASLPFKEVVASHPLAFDHPLGHIVAGIAFADCHSWHIDCP